MDTKLMKAILAMDSYNRGYSFKVGGLSQAFLIVEHKNSPFSVLKKSL